MFIHLSFFCKFACKLGFSCISFCMFPRLDYRILSACLSTCPHFSLFLSLFSFNRRRKFTPPLVLRSDSQVSPRFPRFSFPPFFSGGFLIQAPRCWVWGSLEPKSASFELFFAAVFETLIPEKTTNFVSPKTKHFHQNRGSHQLENCSVPAQTHTDIRHKGKM